MRLPAVGCRYGSLDDLLRLAIEHSDLRTLQRVLTSGGPRGRIALLALCVRFRNAGGGGTVATAVADVDANGTSGAGAEDVVCSVHEEQCCQFLARSYLALHMPDNAGQSLPHSLWI